MLTLTREFWSITKIEANILLDKYLDIIEDLEDYLAIDKHRKWKVEFLKDSETDKLFANLTK